MTARRFAFASILPALLVLVLAFAVRALDLAAQSLWYDEGYTVMFAQRGWLDVITGAARLELNTPLHYLLLKGWMAGAGSSEFAVRLFSAFAGVVTVALLLPLARLAIGRGSAVPALLVALAPVCVMTAREVRMYALSACLCVAATVAFLACLRRGSTSRWLAWAALALAAFATHVLAAFVIGAQALVWFIDALRARRADRGALVAAGTVCAAISAAGLILFVGRADYGTVYGGRLDPLNTLALSLASQALPRLQPAAWSGAAGLLVAMAFLVSGLGLRRDALAARLWVITAVSLIGIALFAVVTGKFTSRYPALVAPLVIGCVGLALARWRIASARAARFSLGATAVLAALSLLGLQQLRANPIYANEDFRAAAAHIRANAQPDEAVLLVSGHFAPVYEYYAGQRGWTALPDDPVLDVNHMLDYASAVPASNAALAGKGGAWLLQWQDDVIDPTGIVPELLKRQSQNLAPQLDSDQFAGLRLRHYRFFQPYQPLPEAIESRSTIEPVGAARGLSSAGCAQPALPRAGDGWIEVHCLWQVKPFVPLSVYTQVSLRLFDAQGRQVLQSDQPIAPKGMPFVPFEKPILGAYFIELPKDLPAGDYTLRAIPYTESEQLAPQVVTPITVLPR